MSQEFRTLEEFKAEFPEAEQEGTKESLLPISGGFMDVKTLLKYSDNQINPDTLTLDSFMAANGTISASSLYDLTDFIFVVEGDVLHFTYGGGAADVRFLTAFNSSKAVQSADGSNSAISTYTVPSGVSYVKLTMIKEVSQCYGCYRNTLEAYVKPYGNLGAIDSNRNIASALNTYWVGKRAISYGDSIVSQFEWQKKTRSIGLDMSSDTNYGVGGSKISGENGSSTAICQDARIDALPTTGIDTLIVLGGTNDWNASVLIGSDDSSNVLEYKGALNALFEKLTTKYPTMQYFICTPPYGEAPSQIGAEGWPNARTNLQGLTVLDYAQATRDIAKLWGITVVDIIANEGVNKVNVETYRKDDGGWIHPTEDAGERIGRIVSDALYGNRPLDNRKYY